MTDGTDRESTPSNRYKNETGETRDLALDMDKVMEEAAIWAARMRDPEGVDMEALDTWLRADPANAPAYNEMLTLWGVIETPARAVSERDRLLAASPHNVRAIGFRKRVRLAVGGAIAASLALTFGLQPIEDALRADAVTAVGSARRVTLADGSIVTMNTNSSIAFDQGPGLRRVALFRGEAYFEVTKDPSRPFLISANGSTVQVVGTKFNVRLTGQRVIVSVNEGRVQLSSGAPGAQPLVLGPGDQGWSDNGQLDEAHNADIDAATAWRRKQAVFYRTPVAQVVADLNRYRLSPIFVFGDSLKDQPISGVFNLKDTDEAAKSIEQTLGVKLTRLPGGIILLRS